MSFHGLPIEPADPISALGTSAAVPQQSCKAGDDRTRPSLGLPRLAIVRGIGAGAMARAVVERIGRRRKVLVSINDLPQRLNAMQRLLLAYVDGVLASPDVVGALAASGIPSSRVVTLGQPGDRSVFTACPRNRFDPDAHRIVYVGDLSPRSGVAEFLTCAIGWAEQNAGTSVEIIWLGTGDLQGVLHAQVVPPNLTQSFSEIPAAGELAAIFRRCGLLAVPSLANVRSPHIADAMAAGLPVVGSVRSAQVRGLVAHEESGWLFDPLRGDEMGVALNAALTTPPAKLDIMRDVGRARIQALQSGRFGEELDQTLRTRLIDMLSSGAPA
jgi:glycosyltransferase involved in cell wall biosynthesis